MTRIKESCMRSTKKNVNSLSPLATYLTPHSSFLTPLSPLLTNPSFFAVFNN